MFLSSVLLVLVCGILGLDSVSIRSVGRSLCGSCLCDSLSATCISVSTDYLNTVFNQNRRLAIEVLRLEQLDWESLRINCATLRDVETVEFIGAPCDLLLTTILYNNCPQYLSDTAMYCTPVSMPTTSPTAPINDTILNSTEPTPMTSTDGGVPFVPRPPRRRRPPQVPYLPDMVPQVANVTPQDANLTTVELQDSTQTPSPSPSPGFEIAGINVPSQWSFGVGVAVGGGLVITLCCFGYTITICVRRRRNRYMKVNRLRHSDTQSEEEETVHFDRATESLEFPPQVAPVSSRTRGAEGRMSAANVLNRPPGSPSVSRAVHRRSVGVDLHMYELAKRKST